MQHGELGDVQSIAVIKRHGTLARLRRQRVPMVCLAIIVLFALAAILAPLLAPHNPNFGYTESISCWPSPSCCSA